MGNLTTEMMTIVSANTRPYEAAMRRGEQSTRMFSQHVKRSGKSVNSFSSIVSGVAVTSLRSFSQAGLAAGGMLASYFAARKLAEYSFGIVKLGADAEQTRVAFEVLTGSARNAARLVDDLNAFAASTPFQTKELQAATKSLLAFGVGSNDIVPTMRKLGDLSAGLGINIGELAEIYGKAKVQGRLFMEDINQLSGRGIPAQAELAKQFGVTAAEIRNMVSDGLINFEHLDKAFDSLTARGSQFGGMMEKQSRTFNGAMSTMKDNATLLLTDIGSEFIKAFPLDTISSRMQKFVSENRTAFKDKLVSSMHEFRESIFNVSDAFAMFGGSFLVLQGHMVTGTAKLIKLNSKMIDGFLVGMKLLAKYQWLTGDSVTAMTTEAMVKQMRQGNEELATAADEFVKLGKLSQSQGMKLIEAGASGSVEATLRNLFQSSGPSFWAKARDEGISRRAAATATAPQMTGPSFWNRAAAEGKANRFNGIESLLGFSRGMAGIGGAIGSRFMTDLLAASGTQMGPNSGILKGSSQAVSLEAERNRAQLDVGKSQLEELREMKQSLRTLVEFGRNQGERAMDAFGGLF